MIIEQCVMCGVDVEGVNRSGKRKCRECQKEFNRNYAHEKYLRAVASGAIIEYRLKGALQMQIKNENDVAYRLASRAKGRASLEGYEFDIVPEDIVVPDKCPVLKTPFKYRTYYTHSLDRIDSTKGYTKDNIQVMSHKANAMKNSASPEELIEFAHWVLETYT